jgi:hypothetical protein
MDDKYHVANFGYVLVSKFVILDRHPIVEMYRDEPDPSLPFSGWGFASGGEESQEDLALYSVRSLLAADPSVEPYLFEPVGSRFRRNDEGIFERVPFEVEEDDDWSA